MYTCIINLVLSCISSSALCWFICIVLIPRYCVDTSYLLSIPCIHMYSSPACSSQDFVVAEQTALLTASTIPVVAAMFEPPKEREAPASAGEGDDHKGGGVHLENRRVVGAIWGKRRVCLVCENVSTPTLPCTNAHQTQIFPHMPPTHDSYIPLHNTHTCPPHMTLTCPYTYAQMVMMVHLFAKKLSCVLHSNSTRLVCNFESSWLG